MDKRGARPKGPSLGDIEKVSLVETFETRETQSTHLPPCEFFVLTALAQVVINQALVMADTFSRRYTPISLEMPRVRRTSRSLQRPGSARLALTFLLLS